MFQPKSSYAHILSFQHLKKAYKDYKLRVRTSWFVNKPANIYSDDDLTEKRDILIRQKLY